MWDGDTVRRQERCHPARSTGSHKTLFLALQKLSGGLSCTRCVQTRCHNHHSAVHTECLSFCRLFRAELAGGVKEDQYITGYRACRSSGRTKSSLIRRRTAQEFRDKCKTFHPVFFFFFVDVEGQWKGNKAKERQICIKIGVSEMIQYWEISVCWVVWSGKTSPCAGLAKI